MVWVDAEEIYEATYLLFLFVDTVIGISTVSTRGGMPLCNFGGFILWV